MHIRNTLIVVKVRQKIYDHHFMVCVSTKFVAHSKAVALLTFPKISVDPKTHKSVVKVSKRFMNTAVL